MFYAGLNTIIFKLPSTVNPPLSPPEAFFISSPFEGGGGGGLIETGGLFNLEKMMVSVLHKELEYKLWKNSSARRLEVMQPRIKIKSELPVGK